MSSVVVLMTWHKSTALQGPAIKPDHTLHDVKQTQSSMRDTRRHDTRQHSSHGRMLSIYSGLNSN